MVLVVAILVDSAPMYATPQSTSFSKKQPLSDELAMQASKRFRKLDFKTASRLWQSAIEELGTGSREAEISTRLRLCLVESLTRQADYATAEKQVAIIENTIERERINNAALQMRLLRRKVQLALHGGNAEKALDCQARLCALIKAELGTLNRQYINEMVFLQWIQFQQGDVTESYITGQQLKTSLERLGLAKSNNQWEWCWMRLGMALACMNRMDEAEAELKRCFNLSIQTHSGNAGLTAAWLTTVAHLQNDTRKENRWLKQLERIKSDRPPKELLKETQNHLKAIRSLWLEHSSASPAM